MERCIRRGRGGWVSQRHRRHRWVLTFQIGRLQPVDGDPILSPGNTEQICFRSAFQDSVGSTVRRDEGGSVSVGSQEDKPASMERRRNMTWRRSRMRLDARSVLPDSEAQPGEVVGRCSGVGRRKELPRNNEGFPEHHLGWRNV